MVGKGCSILAVLAVFGGTLGNVQAAPITFVGSSGSLAASAKFDTSGTNLLVTLTNTSMADVLVPMDVLSSVFFTLSGDPTLTRVSAVLNAGSTVFFGGTDAGGVVGGEWAYNDGLSGAPGGADEGISSVGLDLFGPPDRFPGTNLQGPDSPNGLQYGITSAGDDTTNGNTPVTGTNALIKNSVVFTLSGLPIGFDPSLTGSITNVVFQYGTDLSEPSFPGIKVDTQTAVPEPSTLVLWSLGAVTLVGLGRRRRRQAA